MSYIDTVSHTHLGYIGHLPPIYHPLVRLDDEGYNAGVRDLILGGGSGEHPILRIKCLAYCVYEFSSLIKQ